MNRRKFIGLVAAGLAVGGSLPVFADESLHQRAVPSTKERIPAIGMGTWITFNVEKSLRDDRTNVLEEFFKLGGSMVDCSPMYGRSAGVVGYGLEKLGKQEEVFSASKVWTPSTEGGKVQMERQKEAWGVSNFSLMQVHNLLNWREHLDTLYADKQAGRIKYVGVTTSHGRRHADLERIMQTEPLDFVQFTYNIDHREAEETLLPLAKEKGIGVIVNRPFDGGIALQRYQKHPLPGLAKELGIKTWAEWFLLFVISHPAVTCAIPATSKVEHMRENMAALKRPLVPEAVRAEMVKETISLS